MRGLLGLALAFALLLSMQATASAHLTGVSVTNDDPSRLAAYNFYSLPYVRTIPIEFPAGATDTRLVGLAFRLDGELYAYGSGGTLYVLPSYDTYASSVTAKAVNDTPASSPLTGSEFAVGFNPVQDALGIVDDAGQNLLISRIDGGVVSGGALAYAPGDPNVGTSPVPVGAGYSNQYPGATSSTMYVIDSAADSVAVQGSPNSATPGSDGQLHTVSRLGFDATSLGGLVFLPLGGDYETLLPSGGRQALALLDSGGRQRLYGIGTSPAGEVTSLSPAALVGESGEAYRGLAVPPPSVLRFGVSDAKGSEGRGVDLTVIRSGAVGGRVNADYRIRAEYRSGYPLWNRLPGQFEGSVTLEPGETQKTFHVDIPEDVLIEPDGEVEAVLWDNFPNVVLDPSADSIRVPVQDNDGKTVYASLKRPLGDLTDALQRRRLVVRYGCAPACRPLMTLRVGGKRIASFKASGDLTGASKRWP